MTYKSKLLINFTLLFAAFTLLLVLFQYNREKQYKRTLLDERLRTYADIVAGEVEHRRLHADTVSFVDIAHTLPPELRLTIISRDGVVEYESTHHDPEEMGNHLSRPEVAYALKHTEGSDIRTSATDERDYFYYAKDYRTFIVRVALPFDASVRNFMKADNVFLWFVLMLFPVALVLLIHISDRFGKAVTGLREFMQSADKGLVDYDHIRFPHSELGDIGRSIMDKYQQLEAQGRRIATERERLMRHFHYFDEGIAIFSPQRERIYANARFIQYVNVVLAHPTADISAIWSAEEFRPVLDFLNINGGVRSLTEDAPIFRYTQRAGGNTFAVQALIYGDGSFEVTLADVTKAEKNRKLKQQMSNNITHELRTPVSSIRGYLETLLGCPTLSDERKHYFLQRALAQSERLTDLIRDVALITKTEEAAGLMPREEVDVCRVVDDVADDLRALFEKTGSHLDTQLPAEGLTLRSANYSLVYSIFRNLLENSLRYAGDDRHLTVHCYTLTPEFAYFSVADDGPGVPEEHLPRLFERFYRVSEGRTRAEGGTGLGLSIVRNAVCFHGGDISVRNRKDGTGLEFIFSLKR